MRACIYMHACLAPCAAQNALGANPAVTSCTQGGSMQDAQYVDAKLMQLVALADKSVQGLEDKVAEYEGNITALQQPGAEEARARRYCRIGAGVQLLLCLHCWARERDAAVLAQRR